MTSDSAFSFELGTTSIATVIGDITHIDADVLVSSDDVYLSMGGGVSLALSRAAGDVLRNEARKQPIPLPLGSVVVTGAGRLNARYVLHATTIGHVRNPPADALIACLMQRIIKIASVLQVQHIALPLLGTGAARLPKERVLEYILQSAMYFLSTQNSHIQKFTIVMLDTDGILTTLKTFQEKAITASVILARIQRLHDLCNELPNDQELISILNNRIAESYHELRSLFYFPAIDSNFNFDNRTKLSFEERQDAKKKIEEAISKLEEEMSNKRQLQQIEQRRLRYLEGQKALTGIGTAPETAIEIEDITKRCGQRDREIVIIEERQKMYVRELSSLAQS
jgi:O-acetyl-ADP-ribose deacetylase (regulator of RNase III)